MSPDNFFEEFVCKFLNKELTKEAYLEIEAYYFARNPNQAAIKYLRRRLDNRSIPEFAEQLLAHTKKERFLINLFKKEMAVRGTVVEIKDNGVDNLGGFIGSQDSRIPEPDFLVSLSGGPFEPYEVKNSPSAVKCTFKVINLKEYLAKNARILLFYGTGRLENDPSKIDRKNTRWTIIQTDMIASLLKLPVHQYWEIGGKKGVQILKNDFDRFFTSNQLKSL